MASSTPNDGRTASLTKDDFPGYCDSCGRFCGNYNIYNAHECDGTVVDDILIADGGEVATAEKTEPSASNDMLQQGIHLLKIGAIVGARAVVAAVVLLTLVNSGSATAHLAGAFVLLSIWIVSAPISRGGE